MFTAYDVSKVIQQDKDGGFPFGIGPEQAAKELRAFAEKIAKGEYVLQVVEVKSITDRDDFPMTHVYFQVYEKHVAMAKDPQRGIL